MTSNELIENHPHTAIHRTLYRRCVGSSKQHEFLQDKDKDAIVKDLVTHGSLTRRLFSQDTLMTHLNVARIEQALNTRDQVELERLAKEIIQVDTFVFEEEEE